MAGGVKRRLGVEVRPQTSISRMLRVAGLVLWLALLPTVGRADNASALIALVNDYRNSPQTCAGEHRPMAGVLAPSDALAQVAIDGRKSLDDALAAAAYRAATATVVAITGPSSAAQAMALMKQQYCRALVDRRFSEIGVSHSGDTWRVVMARPLLSGDLGDWREAGKAILDLVNEARGKARSCGDRHFAATTPLAWSEPLADAALAHSRDMAEHDYFSHAAPSGDTAAERARRQGYRWRRIGENIAAGQGAPKQVVAGWLASPHHCSNIMNAGYADMGAAYATNASSEMAIYWTQVFGKR